MCRESFTQKRILLVHYNSLGHLRNLKKKKQQSETENTASSESDLDKSGVSETPEASSPKKEEPESSGDNPLQSALQQAMIARLQLLNPMLRLLRAPGMPPLNPAMAMMGAMPGLMPPAVPQLQQLQQLAMAQQLGGQGNARMPDPSLLLQQLSQLQGGGMTVMTGMSKMENKAPGLPPLPFPPASQPHQLAQVPQGGSPQFSQDLFGEQKRARQGDI